MKTVTASDENDSTETGIANIELLMRQRARKIIAQVFPDVTPDFRLIEDVTSEIVITDEDGLLEQEINQETTNLFESREWAKQAYGDDSPAATMAAYQVLHGQTNDERWYELNEKLEELEGLIKRKK